MPPSFQGAHQALTVAGVAARAARARAQKRIFEIDRESICVMFGGLRG